jgi:ABC-type branched-subunit amino acid transport system substrate-binding protein
VPTIRRFRGRRLALSWLALLGALLIGPPHASPAAGDLPGAARIGYIAQVRSVAGTPAIDPASVETAGHAGLLGGRLGAEEMAYTARLVGARLSLLEAAAGTPDEAVRAAEWLVGQHVFALVGGFDTATAQALSRFAERRQVLFFNVGATEDRLRNADCARYAFHIEASDAMYLDAVADWFIRGLAFLVDEDAPQGVRIIRRSPARAWFLVTEHSPPWEARARRLHVALEQRHWGSRIVTDAVVEGQQRFDHVLRLIPAAHPDLVFLLLPAARQLEFYREFEQARMAGDITGFPEPVTQTRAFFAALLTAAPRTTRGGIRFVSFEPTFSAVGGPQLSQRFFRRWHAPMDGPAWTSWLGIKILWEAFQHLRGGDGPSLARYLESAGALFEGYQGIGLTFRPWDGQLRHPLMASRLTAYSDDEMSLAQMVGQFPNVLAPGRTPSDVLDQLGDPARGTRCRAH